MASLKIANVLQTWYKNAYKAEINVDSGSDANHASLSGTQAWAGRSLIDDIWSHCSIIPLFDRRAA